MTPDEAKAALAVAESNLAVEMSNMTEALQAQFGPALQEQVRKAAGEEPSATSAIADLTAFKSEVSRLIDHAVAELPAAIEAIDLESLVAAAGRSTFADVVINVDYPMRELTLPIVNYLRDAGYQLGFAGIARRYTWQPHLLGIDTKSTTARVNKAIERAGFARSDLKKAEQKVASAEALDAWDQA